jgi:hypothetical protein
MFLFVLFLLSIGAIWIPVGNGPKRGEQRPGKQVPVERQPENNDNDNNDK